MWKLTQLQQDIWEKKYQYEGESFDEWLDRVSGGNQDVRRLIEEQKFLFGGRILSNRGLDKFGKKVTYSNCYVLPQVGDSIEDIYQTCSDLARTFSMGGGVGIDISKLRPIGAPVNNTAKSTTGACSFMPTFSQVAETIGQNGRRGALMISLDVNHPEVEKFINMKANDNQVTKANISIRVDDEFMNSVVEDLYHECKFTLEDGSVITKKVEAKKLFRLLAQNNSDWAEPGILYWDRIENYNIMSEDKDFKYAGVNPCAEEPLPAGGSCLLGSFNLSAYVTLDGRFNYEDFKKDIPIVVKAMNEVLDEGLPLHPLEMQRETVRDYRQIGIGVMGIADMLIKMGIKYGSEYSIKECNSIGFVLANESLKASALLAKEEGAFPKCNIENIIKSEYIHDNCDGTTYDLIKKYGLRNSQLLTIAPTGTLSTMLGISGGIEPIFANYYTRKTESLHGEDKYYKVYTPIVDEYMKANNIEDDKDLPNFFVTAQTLNPYDRIDMQSIWQEHIDASISSTLNLPNETTVDEIEKLYIYAWDMGLKGMTIFRDGCKRMGILTIDAKEEEPKEEVKEGLKRGEWAPIPDDTIYVKKKIYTGCGKLNLFIGFSPSKNNIVEMYSKRSAEGGCEHNIDGEIIAMSGMLRLGGNLENIRKSFSGCGGCNSFVRARAKGKALSPGKSCPTAILNMIESTLEELRNNNITNNVTPNEKNNVEVKEELSEQEKLDKGICPDCGTKLDFIGGCVSCIECGFSKCN